jgi:EAL domain-containing protein (putative c-di-GMP-specific phosphodiesterase class I)
MSRNKIKEQLVDALTTNSLELYWQPYFDLVSDNIIGAEVLLRWNRNDEIISPVGFIPAIEHDELSIAIGDYVLTHAFRQIEALNARGLDVNINISINLFQRQLLQPDFEFKILKLLDVFPAVHPNQITFEILETVAIEDFELINMIISNLSARGIKFAIDDFGTGYSSLTYFSKIQAHTIKIDRSFISQIEDEGTDHAIIESIIGLSKTFNKTLIAEGIETEEQRKMLLNMGCSIGQGYLFSKAVQFAEFENMLLRQFAINK